MQDLAVIRCTCAEILRAFGMTDAEGGKRSLKGSTMNDRVLDQKVSMTSA